MLDRDIRALGRRLLLALETARGEREDPAFLNGQAATLQHGVWLNTENRQRLLMLLRRMDGIPAEIMVVIESEDLAVPARSSAAACAASAEESLA